MITLSFPFIEQVSSFLSFSNILTSRTHSTLLTMQFSMPWNILKSTSFNSRDWFGHHRRLIWKAGGNLLLSSWAKNRENALHKELPNGSVYPSTDYGPLVWSHPNTSDSALMFPSRCHLHTRKQCLKQNVYFIQSVRTFVPVNCKVHTATSSTIPGAIGTLAVRINKWYIAHVELITMRMLNFSD